MTTSSVEINMRACADFAICTFFEGLMSYRNII
jgi:hypothetical protein